MLIYTNDDVLKTDPFPQTTKMDTKISASIQIFQILKTHNFKSHKRNPLTHTKIPIKTSTKTPLNIKSMNNNTNQWSLTYQGAALTPTSKTRTKRPSKYLNKSRISPKTSTKLPSINILRKNNKMTLMVQPKLNTNEKTCGPPLTLSLSYI
jgi:hypothetical protein